MLRSACLSLTSEWLDSFFADFDYVLLHMLHQLAELGGVILTPLMRAITFIGEKGVLMLALALVLMLFKRTRRAGICIFGAVCCGALITNIILKDTVARSRPLASLAEYAEWWRFVGAPAEDGFSFPSGHVTAMSAGMISLCLCCGRKYIIPAVASIALMGISRNYLMAHYPSDVLAAIVIGAASAVIAYLITCLIYRLLEKYEHVAVCRLVLDADVRRLSNKKI